MPVKLNHLIIIYGIAGAREQFEDLCTQLIRSEYPELKKVRIVKGDGGIDAYDGSFVDAGGINVFQIKFFPKEIGDSQKDQIRDSFTSLIDKNPSLRINSWTLCLPIDLSANEQKWFDEWKTKQQQLDVVIQNPWGALKLEHLLYQDKNKHIREAFFREEHLKQIREAHEMLVDLVKTIFERVPDPTIADKKRKEHELNLATFIQEGQSLRTRLIDEQLPIKEHNEWVNKVETYLLDNFGAGHKVRFSDFSGMFFFSGNGSEKSRLSNLIEGRTRRLHEFLQELARI